MFKRQNFCHIASNNRNNVKVGVFVYRTTDDVTTVTTSGYFNERIIDINLHDLIIHEQINIADSTIVERNVLCVIKRTADNVETKVIKSHWEVQIEQEIDNINQHIANLVLNDLADVTISTPTVGQYLRWNGVQWINMDGDGGGGGGVWGAITGDINDQADLQSALSDKADVTALAGKADIDLGNIDSDGEDVIKTLAPDGDYDNTVSGLSATTLQTAIDELATTNPLLNLLYPVGAVYIGTQATCPLATLIPGSTWQQIQGRYLLASGTIAGTSEVAATGSLIAAGLPQVWGSVSLTGANVYAANGAFSVSTTSYSGWGSTSGQNSAYIDFFANRTSSVYGQSATARPPAYAVNVWVRTA